MIDNWCLFFQNIEQNPHAKIKGFTNEDMLNAKHHILKCSDCFNITNRVTRMCVPKQFPDNFGKN